METKNENQTTLPGLGAADNNSQRKFFKNYIGIIIKTITYNILNWFKKALLPFNLVKKSIRKIREIPANIVKKGGRRYTIRLPQLDCLKEIVESIKDRLYMFAFWQCYYRT